MTRAARGALLLLALAVTRAAASEPPPCEAQVQVEPAQAFVGEQLVYRLHLRRRDDVRAVHWARPLSAPSFRVESLPTRTDLEPVTRQGRRYLGVEERRAIFPSRAGVLEVPPVALRCVVAEGTGERELDVEVPGVRVQVAELPEQGRPEGFEGVVGQVAVRASAQPTELALGSSLRLVVEVEGAANLWELSPPLAPSGLPGMDVLPRPAELARDAAAQLRLRRYFRYDLVPRRVGSLEIPALRIPWFDPEARRYAVAVSAPIALEVHPPQETPSRALPTPAPPAAAGARAAPALALALAAGGATALLLRWRARRRAAGRAVEAALAEAEALRAAGDPGGAAAALSRALRLAFERHVPGAGSRSAEEIAAAVGSAEAGAAALLVELDRVRFAGEATHAPSPAAVRQAIAQLRARRGVRDPRGC